MNIRPATADHRRKPGQPKQVRIAVISTDGTYMSCSCKGWDTAHPRQKVREDRAQRHLDKQHGGRGLWL